MEYGTIEREIYLDASPDIVFTVISSAEHIAKWWSDEAEIEPVGAEGRIVFHSQEVGGESKRVPVSVVEATPPHRFAFRWDFPAGAAPTPNNSLLVTFDLQPSGDGTMLTMTETGFREQGWEAAVLEANYHDHANGWSHFIPRLGDYVEALESSR